MHPSLPQAKEDLISIASKLTKLKRLPSEKLTPSISLHIEMLQDELEDKAELIKQLRLSQDYIENLTRYRMAAERARPIYPQHRHPPLPPDLDEPKPRHSSPPFYQTATKAYNSNKRNFSK